MSARNSAVYVVGGALLFAYLAAANMPSPGSPAPHRPPEAVATTGSNSLAGEVRAHASKLASRLAEAPAPDEHSRNPFSFAARPRLSRDANRGTLVVAAVAAEPAPAVIPVPALTLMGVAEETVAGGVRRTAVIGGEGDTIYLVIEGQRVGDRYKVTKIGADAVELEDLLTHGYRRIAMR
ncbi:MAG: hypothetical protein ABIQ52_12450 [Vicinamibacterales bacterium]